MKAGDPVRGLVIGLLLSVPLWVLIVALIVVAR